MVNTQRFGSRNEDEDKPKRTTCWLVHENMTDERLRHFIRGEFHKTLGQAYGRAMDLHANLVAPDKWYRRIWQTAGYKDVEVSLKASTRQLEVCNR